MASEDTERALVDNEPFKPHHVQIRFTHNEAQTLKSAAKHFIDLARLLTPESDCKDLVSAYEKLEIVVVDANA